MRKFNAIELDRILRSLKNNSLNPERYDKIVKEKINELYVLLDKIKPLKEDEYKILYFNVERGTFEDYINDEDEDIDLERYKEYYKEDYPDDVYWYRLVSSKYESFRTISINYKNIICADMNLKSTTFENRTLQELLDFLIFKVGEIIKMLENNTYNDYILNNLSYKNRFGVIKKSDYWNLFHETKENILKNITQEEIDYFIKNARDNTNERIKDMTSGKYFEAVRLSYQYNNYDLGNLSDKELYLKYADGRDEGLSELDLNSSEEFENWYKDRERHGGHPWEIIRGHSFARVNLYVGNDENGYYFSIDGTRILRDIEIAKIFIALSKNNIPIRIGNVDIIKNSLSGNDYIGIVPHDLTPIYCESYFKENNPREFTNKLDNRMLDYIIWEDIDKIYLKEE